MCENKRKTICGHHCGWSHSCCGHPLIFNIQHSQIPKLANLFWNLSSIYHWEIPPFAALILAPSGGTLVLLLSLSHCVGSSLKRFQALTLFSLLLLSWTCCVTWRCASAILATTSPSCLHSRGFCSPKSCTATASSAKVWAQHSHSSRRICGWKGVLWCPHKMGVDNKVDSIWRQSPLCANFWHSLTWTSAQ